MDLELNGKVAVVTGGSKGIGLAIVRMLAEEGARVVAGALTTESLQGLDRVYPVAVDLVEPDGSQRLVAEAVDRHGGVDVLVNNVGGLKLRVDGFLSITDADFEHSLQLNFFAALRATRAAVAAMLERGRGTIVNVASVNSFFHPDGLVIDYGAAKAALLNVAKALSQELGPRASGSTASPPARSRPTSGWAPTVWRRPSGKRRGSRRTPFENRRQPGWRLDASRRRKRWRRSSSCSHHLAPPT